eukprot:TRINITY_DN2928_c0_g1_i1.p1 TRINITY_DN2928_c0_g1~~TRINITY_DN2928_c0_g1_i1.p1  ORF type:complete len:932 (-),score=325.18 TRINITY_DN2928_c0_g1_i1:333-3128(-)
MPAKKVKATPRTATSDDDDEDAELKEAELKEERGFTKFYKALQEEERLIRIFQRKEIYYVHGQNAVFVAKEFYRTTSALRYWAQPTAQTPPSKKPKLLHADDSQAAGSQRPSDGDGDGSLAYVYIRGGKELCSLLRLLLFDKACRVEVWSNASTTAEDWHVSKKATPGQLQDLEDMLYSHDESLPHMATVAVHVGVEKGSVSRVVGVCIADTVSRVLSLCEFPDDERLCNLESVLLQSGARECRLSTTAAADHSLPLPDLCAACSVSLLPLNPGVFALNDSDDEAVLQDLRRLLRTADHIPFELLSQQRHALAACAAIYRSLELLAHTENLNTWRIGPFNFRQYMRLHAPAVAALHLLPDPSRPVATGGSAAKTNLFGLLNECRTAMGTRRLHQWVRLPLLDVDLIRRRHDLVEALVDSPPLLQQLWAKLLRRVPDLDRVAKRLLQSKATLHDCFIVYTLVTSLPQFAAALDTYSGKHGSVFRQAFCTPLQNVQAEFGSFTAMIEATMDVKLAAAQHEYVILPSHDRQLASVAQEKAQIEKQIQKHWAEVAAHLGVAKDKALKLDHSKTHSGYFFRLSKKDEKVLHERTGSGNKRGYHSIDTLKKDGVKFRDSHLATLNQQLNQLSTAYSEQQAVLAEQLIAKVAEFMPCIEAASDLFAELDVLTSFAHVAVSSTQAYVRPSVSAMGQGDIVLTQSRHPCLEVQDGVTCIANDAILRRADARFNIITGPNMGGKSTFIRQVGLVVLMAQIGSFVPCAAAQVSVVDAILTRIGADDSQMRGVSTFMAEMLQMAHILNSATRNSLILIDELGRGTSTADGYGIQYAVALHICTQIECFCYLATHFHELTTLSSELSFVRNWHADAMVSDDQLVLLYKIVAGACHQSFGINVAQLCGLPDSILEDARQRAEQLEDFENMIAVRGGSADALAKHQ